MASRDLLPLRVHDVIYEGEVSKRGNFLRSWRSRYFVLWREGPLLQYFKRNNSGQWRLKGALNPSQISSCACQGPVH